MARSYTQLDLAERRRIASLLEVRVPVAVIAAHPAGYASHETIYRHIYWPVGREDRLYALTARGRRQRRTRFGRKPRGAHIEADQAIAARLPQVAARTEFGHWEGDLVMFGRRSSGGNVTSLQERQSRFLMLVGNNDRRSAAVAAGINAMLSPLPAWARRSITFDRGTEIMGYAALRPTQSWFCDPHSPWQKGGVENANSRLRRYLPIDSTISERTSEALVALTARLNTTPRRCLGYRTPAEAFHDALAASAAGAWAPDEAVAPRFEPAGEE